jgi:ribosome maturation factor RimP
MDLKVIENIVLDILKDDALSLESIKTKTEFGESILEIIVDGDDLSSDHLGNVNTKIAEVLTDDFLDPSYYIEVSSPGAERPLKTKEAVLGAVGKYVFAKTNKEEAEGYLLAFDGTTLVVQINLKGRLKKLNMAYSDLLEIRLAIKF